MTAFRRAVALGTDMLELDCHLTKDGKVVVAHDASLSRTTECEGFIADYNHDELPSLRKTLPIDFMPGMVFSGESSDRSYPLLEEVFKEFSSTPINIDIKVNSDQLISKVSTLVKAHNREHITVWGNVKNDVALKCYKENPSMGLFFSMRRTISLLFRMYSGLLPFTPIKETHLEIFVPSLSIKLYGHHYHLKWWHTLFAKIGDAILIRKCLFKHLDKRGIQTFLWVLNNDEEYRLGFDSGAAGIMTDYPSRLKSFLERNPKYMKSDSA